MEAPDLLISASRGMCIITLIYTSHHMASQHITRHITHHSTPLHTTHHTTHHTTTPHHSAAHVCHAHISPSLDRSIIVWKLHRDEEKYGVAHKRLTGSVIHDTRIIGMHAWTLAVRLCALAICCMHACMHACLSHLMSVTSHSHYVQDVAISSDGQFALSGSWDGTLRLW